MVKSCPLLQKTMVRERKLFGVGEVFNVLSIYRKDYKINIIKIFGSGLWRHNDATLGEDEYENLFSTRLNN